jgi:heavy metal sensor kinase
MRALRSIRTQLALWYLVVLMLGMTAFGVASWVVLRQVLLENRHRGIDQRLSALEVFLSQESRGDSLLDLSEESREYATALPEGQGLRVRTSSGQLLFERKPAGGDTLERSRKVLVRGHPIEITLIISLADFYRVLGTLAWVMFAVFPMVLVIAMGGGWWLAKRALQPVGAMTREARQISAHDLSARVSIPPTGDELQDLAEAWNELLARIESAVRAVKRVTADAAHELRTPVTVVRATAELSLRHPRSAESYRQTIESIAHETVQMTELLDQLLLLARGDAGEWKFRFDTVFADQILRGLRTALAPLAESKELQITWEIPLDSVMIRADEAAFRRLAFILIDNALKHTPAGGSISVRLYLGESECVMAVADTGAGISAEDLPHIFERFYRADAARTPGVGAGLGLAIAHTIVDAHQGTLEVASTGNSGTTVRVTLPAITNSVASPEVYAENRTAKPSAVVEG